MFHTVLGIPNEMSSIHHNAKIFTCTHIPLEHVGKLSYATWTVFCKFHWQTLWLLPQSRLMCTACQLLLWVVTKTPKGLKNGTICYFPFLSIKISMKEKGLPKSRFRESRAENAEADRGILCGVYWCIRNTPIFQQPMQSSKTTIHVRVIMLFDKWISKVTINPEKSLQPYTQRMRNYIWWEWGFSPNHTPAHCRI